jgi:hypothetical protein
MRTPGWVVAGVGVAILAGVAFSALTQQVPLHRWLGVGPAFLLAVAGSWAMWLWWRLAVAGRRAEVLGAIKAGEEALRQAVERSKIVGSAAPGLDADSIFARFATLETDANAARDTKTLRAIEASAAGLAHLRAYLLPKEALVPEALVRLQSMKNWGVPADTLDELEKRLLSVVQGADVAAAGRRSGRSSRSTTCGTST